MFVKPLLTLKVAVVPSWFDEIVTLEKIPREDLVSFNKLYGHAEEGRCSKEEVYGYIMANQRLVKIFGDLFSDLYMISQEPENLAFIEKHQIGIDVFQSILNGEDEIKKLESSQKDEDTSIFKSKPGLLNKEHYVPYLLQGDCLLMLGSPESTYKNKRSFYNAIMECVHKGFGFDVIKSTNMMKHYLRHAVDE